MLCVGATAETLVLTQDVIVSNFARQADVLVDAPISMTVEEALESPLLSPYPEDLVNIGPQETPVWVRFEVRNGGNEWGAWVVNTLRSNVEILEIYKVGDRGVELIFNNGDEEQRRDSLKRYFNLVAPLNLGPGESATLLVRFQAAVSGWLPMRVIPSGLLTRFTFSQFSLFILTTAGTGILILYNLLLFLVTRNTIYVLYTAATGALLLACLHLQGMTTAWWFYALPEWGRIFGAIASNLSALLLLTFARKFLSLRGRRWADAWYRLASSILLFHLIAVPGSMLLRPALADLLVMTAWTAATATYVSLPLQAFFAHRGRRTEEILLGTAWTILASQFVIFLLSGAGILRGGYMDWYLLGPACFIEAALVAVSIALRVRRLQDQKDAADAKSVAALQDMSERARMVLAASHDARNLVTGAMTVNQRLEAAKDLGQARSHAQQLGEILGSVQQTMNLMVSNNRQVGSGGIPMIEEINVPELFNTLALTFRERAELAGKTITTRTLCDSIAGDRNMVIRVLSNLLANAIDYSKGERVLLVCRRSEDHVSIRVYDQGPGMTPSQLVSIVEGHKSLRFSPQSPGVGVGLSVCRELSMANGARIESASRPEGGSMFGLNMPAPDISQVGQRLVFVGDPGLWTGFVDLIRGSAVLSESEVNADTDGIRVFSETTHVRPSPHVNIVACFDRSPANRDKWSRSADAILCFPLTLPALAQAISVACHRRTFAEDN